MDSFTTANPSIPTCYDGTLHQQYYCTWGYSCCGIKSCCSNYSNHPKFASSQWFWFIWAVMIILVCCCSYIRRRKATGENLLPVAFFNNRRRRLRTQDGSVESEEELLPGDNTASGNSVYFIPPGIGDQSQWGNADWYRANKPPPYSMTRSDQGSSTTGASAGTDVAASGGSVRTLSMAVAAATGDVTSSEVAPPPESANADANSVILLPPSSAECAAPIQIATPLLVPGDGSEPTTRTASNSSTQGTGPELGPPPAYTES